MNPQDIKNIRPDKNGYTWKYAGESFHITDNNDVPLLSDNYPSQIWLYKNYGYLMRLFNESAKVNKTA